MAEAIARHYFGRRIFFDSAGVDPQPLDPMAAAVMTEIGLSLTDHRARRFNVLADTSFDLVVAFSDEAYREARRICRTAHVALEFWPIETPRPAEGSREARLCHLRHIRDRLLTRIRDRFGAVAIEV